jgi:hypothetical protein
MKRVLRDVSAAVLILLLTAGAAWAQGTAQINGTVTDESGAVLPGVTVTVTQTDTGLVRTTVTDGTGGYVLPNLPTGPYRLEVALQGFRSYVQTGIVLQVGGTPTVDAVLGLGSLEESVTVEAAAPLVDVRSAGISAVVDNEAILELPLQGRQVTDLIVLAGAAVQTGAPSRGVPGGVYISVAGGQPMGVAYTLDGAEHNNPQSNGNLPLPFPDALQEFQVATSGLSAENGVKSGASVNAVTKSGTNRFSGSAFEFLRDKRFNAPEHFADFGPDGKQLDDGLKRNQFGGTLGGPIIQDRLFFFGAYQGTFLRQTPTSNISFVPTAQMVAGDFTALTSPACNDGRQLTLRSPFVNNRVDPALLSPAALNVTALLPTTTDPCGEVQWESVQNRDRHEPITRIDYQATNNQLFFGRYMYSKDLLPPSWEGPGDNILKTGPGNSGAGTENKMHALVLGQTHVMSSSLVNAVRFALTKADSHRYHNPGLFGPNDVGVNMYVYPTFENSDERSQFGIGAEDNFDLVGSGERRSTHNLYGFSDDLTLVRGSHQFGFGGNVRWWEFNARSTSRTAGSWEIDGSATGHALADFLLGRVAELEVGGPAVVDISNWYLGIYAQDTWRVSNRVTLNAGVRWEPYFGQSVRNLAVAIFDQAKYDQGVTSGVFLNAPPGMVYPGDPGFPPGKTGLNKQWSNFAPRVGLAWDVHGDGSLAVRSSYSIGYDFMAGEYHNINASAPPFGSRSLRNDVPLDDPWRDEPGGDPHPIVPEPNAPYINYGAFGTMNPDINSPRMQQWNVMVEQQLGTDWGVSASYLGSYSDRLWHSQALNPGVYLGMDPCTLQTPEGPVFYRTCTTLGNLNHRREFTLADPIKSAKIGALDLNSDVGWQKYRGLKLTARRRSATGLSINGSYTLSKCTGTPTPLVSATFNQISAGYSDPSNPDFDAGYCDQDRKHLGTLNMGYQTPDIGGGVAGVLVSNWRVSGILSARSGSRLNIILGRDVAFTGISTQRPTLVPGESLYGPGKDASNLEPGERIANYLNADAFERPEPGTYGNLTRNAAVGPKFWEVNLAISRLVPFGTQRVELRLETFNLFNTFNWGNPEVRQSRGTFGRIQSQAGTPRILQFGVKYDF